MQQSDYLMRQIEQLGRVLGKVLAHLLGLREQGKAHQGMEHAVELFREELDLDLKLLLSLPEDEYMEAIVKLTHWNEAHYSTLADILIELAEGCESGGETQEAALLYRKVLRIYRYLDETGMAFSLDRHYKTERIRQFLGSGSTP